MHDDSEDQSCIDLCFPRDLQNGIVDRTLFRAAIEMHQCRLLVEYEHLAKFHPICDRGEVLLYPTETIVVFGIRVGLVSGGEGWVIPLQAVGNFDH